MPTLASAVTVLQLIVSPDAVRPDVSMATLVGEVRAIWAPYVDVVLSLPGSTGPEAEHSVELRFADPPASSSAAGVDGESLGWIEFVNGEPQPVIAVSPERARRLLATATYLGQPVRRLPAGLVQRLTAIALGRAVAHELGHYLLRTPTHAAQGLMRASLRAQHLIEAVAPMQLAADDIARLRARVQAPALARSPEGVMPRGGGGSPTASSPVWR